MSGGYFFRARLLRHHHPPSGASGFSPGVTSFSICHRASRAAICLLIGLVLDKKQAIELVARHLAIPGAEAHPTDRRRKERHAIRHGEIPPGTPLPYAEFSEDGRTMRVDLRVRFGYADALPWIRKITEGSQQALIAVAGPDAMLNATASPDVAVAVTVNAATP